MENKCYANKRIIAIESVLVLCMGVLLVYILLKLKSSAVIPIIGGGFSVYIVLLYKQITDFKLVLIVRKEGIELTRHGITTYFAWEKIDRITVGGVRKKSYFSSLFVYSEGNQIMIDKNIKGYQEAWSIVAQETKRNNPHAMIDPLLLKI